MLSGGESYDDDDDWRIDVRWFTLGLVLKFFQSTAACINSGVGGSLEKRPALTKIPHCLVIALMHRGTARGIEALFSLQVTAGSWVGTMCESQGLQVNIYIRAPLRSKWADR